MKSTKLSLEDNLTALTELFNSIQTNSIADVDKLRLYSGFGNIKEIALNPDNDNDWSTSNNHLRVLIKELHQLLRGFFPGETSFQKVIDSLRSSTLTAFFTPPELIEAIVSPF